MATLVKLFEGEEGTIPFTKISGSAPNVSAKEGCLVVWPEPIEKSGLIITDKQLKCLGYTHRERNPQIALRRYFTVNGKKLFVDFKTSARWIAIQPTRETYLFFNKPHLVNGEWYSNTGYRLYRCSPYMNKYKQSLRKLYPMDISYEG